MKKIFNATIITLLFLVSPVFLRSVAASDVTVYLDGVELVYTLEAKPQIINDRTMVPIRETANQLGIEVTEYNPDTRTMTLMNGGSVIMHTLNTDFIIKDGMVEYFTPSTVVENRSLMPIRMLASAINAYVDWEDDTKSVVITTSGVFTPPPPDVGYGNLVPQPAGRPSVVSALPNKNNVAVGEEVVITVTATASTTQVRLMRAGVVVLAASEQYRQEGANKIFTISYTPAESTLLAQRLIVVAGENGVFNMESFQAFSLFVAKGLDIISVQTQSTTVNRGGTAVISIRADLGVTMVTLVDSLDGKVYEVQPSSSNESGSLFEFNIKMDEFGLHVFKVGITGPSGFRETNRTIEIDVTSTAASPLEITKIEYNNNASRDVGKRLPVIVTTNDMVDRIVVSDSSGKMLDRVNTYSPVSGGGRAFTLFVEILQNGQNNYIITAYDSTDTMQIDEPFNVPSTGQNTGSSNIGILLKSVEPDVTAAYIGDSVTVKVITPFGVDVSAKDPSGFTFTIFSENYNENISKRPLSDGGYEYTISIPVKEYGIYQIIGVRSNANPEIYYLSISHP